MIPLRLRRRRDGSFALTGAAGDVTDPERSFPTDHEFTADWLLGAGAAIAALDGDRVYLSLANASATYTVEGVDGVYRGTLESSELFDAPPVDEEAALALAQQVRAGAIAGLAALAEIDEQVAERVLIAQGAIAAEATTAPRRGEG